MNRIPFAPFTWALVAINVMVFLFAEYHGDTTTSDTLVQFGASERGKVWAGQYWRFVTPMFLHIGWIHLLWNSYAMIGWCSHVEKALGAVRFLLASSLSGIGGTAVSLLCHDVVAAGASGAVFGIIGVVLVLCYRNLGSWEAFLKDPFVRQVTTVTAAWVLIGFAGAIRMDNFGHLGGLVFGLYLGAILTSQHGLSTRRGMVATAGFVIALVGVVTAAAVGWSGQTSIWGGHEAAVAGDNALQEKDYREAITHYNRAELLGFSDYRLHVNRGVARMELGDLNGAFADNCLALRSHPQGPEAFLNRALVQITRRDEGDIEQAITDLARALEFAPGNWSHRQQAVDLLKQAQWIHEQVGQQ